MRQRYSRLQGGSMFGSIANALYPTTLQNVIAKTGVVPGFKGVFPGELHNIGANFEGPQTRIVERMKRGDRGTTASDEAARQHDIDYLNIGTALKNKKLTREQAAADVRTADNKLQSRIRQGLKTDHSLLNRIHASAGDNGMAIKKIAEDIGVIDKTAFLGAGAKERDPAWRLRKLAKKIKAKQGGMIAPSLPLYKIPKPHYTIPIPKVPPPRNLIDIGPAPLVLSKDGGAAGIAVDKALLQQYLESLPIGVLEKLNAAAKSGGLIRFVKRARRKMRR